MSTSIRVARRGRGGRLVCFVAGLTLVSGGSVAALLALTSMATGGLVAAASHRPSALAEFRQLAPTLRAEEGDRRMALLSAEHDRRFGQTNVELGDGLAALGERLVESPDVVAGAAVRLASTDRPAVRAAPPRVITPAKPIEAAVVPTAPVIRLASLEPAAATNLSVIAPTPLVQAPIVERPIVAEPIGVPVPRPRPADFARMATPARVEIASVRLEARTPDTPAPWPTALAYASPEFEPKSDAPGDFFRGLLGRDDAARLLGGRRGIAVYDIASATVRLPNGERLEAHSGLGHRQDNPSYVREKNRGPTPPNVYDLRMREALFHGSEAIRLTPRDLKKVFNRDGLLAHPYMYAGGGSRSQSNGCVVFKDYGRFLRAFKAGEITKLVVTPNMAELPTHMSSL